MKKLFMDILYTNTLTTPYILQLIEHTENKLFNQIKEN